MKKFVAPVLAGAFLIVGSLLGHGKAEAETLVKGKVTATTAAYSDANIKHPLHTTNNKGKKVLVTVGKGSTVYKYNSSWFKESIVYTKYTLVKHKYVKGTLKATVYVPTKYVKIPTPPQPVESKSVTTKPVVTPPSSLNRITLVEYNQIQNGMTLAQVQQIIGSGVKLTQTSSYTYPDISFDDNMNEIDTYHTDSTYEWTLPSNSVVMDVSFDFTDNILQDKYEFGLN